MEGDDDSLGAASPTAGGARLVSIQDNRYSKVGKNDGRGGRVVDNTQVEVPGFCCPAISCNGHNRIVSRENGRPNISHTGLQLKWFTYLADNFTTIINCPWHVIGLLFGGTYVLSWLIFGGVWTAVARYEGNYNNTCLEGINGFAAALLFSIETQVTIGYGNTYIRNECTSGLIVLIFQCVIGLIIDALLLGLLFTKITRPRNRRKTILFSEKSVLYEEDGDQYLEFRIGNLRKSQIAECHVRLVLYWYRDVEGEERLEQYDLECGYESGTDRLVLITPAVVRHKIDESSPLWELGGPSAIIQEDLEVVVVLEGIVEATGLTLQALWSYTSEEMVVGEKLRPIVFRRGRRWVVDFSRFNEIVL